MSAWRVSLGDQLSTALSQGHEANAKWNVQRGLSTSQASTSGCLWVTDSHWMLLGSHSEATHFILAESKTTNHGKDMTDNGSQHGLNGQLLSEYRKKVIE